MRFRCLIGFLAVFLTSKFVLGTDGDGENLDDKLKHLEEDVALVKELLRLRGSKGGTTAGTTLAPSSGPKSSAAPTLAKDLPAVGNGSGKGKQDGDGDGDGDNSKKLLAPSSSPMPDKKKKQQHQQEGEKFPPSNSHFSDLRSTVTYDAPGDRSRLAIMSFKFNQRGEVSSYVDRIFGAHGLYYDDKMSKELGAKDFTDEEIKDAESRFNDAFKLKDQDKSLDPPCSVDMLGMWHPYLSPDIGDKNFVKSPGVKYKNDMLNKLLGSNALGEASIHVSSLIKGPEGEKSGKEEWKCYYRDLWKLDNRASAVFFYCPAPSKQHCDHLEAMATHKEDPNMFGWGRILVEMEMQSLVARDSDRSPWRMSFEAKIKWRGREQERDNTREFKRRASMAVCTIIPYSTFDKEKASLNGVMIFEWLRYYLRMGYRVHIYDRDGTNAKFLFNPGMNGDWPQFLAKGEKGRTYHGGASTGNFEWNNLVYHNYTMLGVLDSTTNGVMYDNTEGVVAGKEIPSTERQGSINVLGSEERKWLTDRDKSLTFTQCRMEIDALWGIGDVLTVDFDEFLYCPEAHDTPKDQYDFVRGKINEERDKGMHAVQFFQRVPTNTTDLMPRECILDKLKNGDASIFECYGPYEAIVAAHSFKSFEIGHVCPVQNYHQAYNTNRGFRIYECGNKNYLSLDTKTCGLLHLTTHPKDFEKPCCGASEWNREQKEKYRNKEINELWKVAHWNQ